MSKCKEISLHGQTMILFPDRILFWKEEKMMVVADPHFGKAQIFRDKGIPLPGGTTARDLERLSCLMDHFRPHKLLFLGDLMHGRIENTNEFVRLIDHWRQCYLNVELLLSTGNHDLKSDGLPDQFRFDHVAAEIKMGAFIFSHKPRSDSSFYRIAGHVHPAVTISGKGGLKETLPCFCIGPRAALLPAFGSFTGNKIIHPTPDDRIFVVAGDEVIEMENEVVHGTHV